MEHTDNSTPRYGVENGRPTYFPWQASVRDFRPVPSPAVRRSARSCPAGDGTARRIGGTSITYGIWDGANIRLKDGRLVAYEPDANGILVRAVEQPVRVEVKRRQDADGALWFAVGYRYRGKIRWFRTLDRGLAIRKRPPTYPSKAGIAANWARLVSDHLAGGDGDLEPPAPNGDRGR